MENEKIYVKMTTLSPIHVGSGTRWKNKMDVVYFDSEKKLGIIDNQKVFGKIGKEGIEKWIASIQKGDVTSFFKDSKPEDYYEPIEYPEIIITPKD